MIEINELYGAYILDCLDTLRRRNVKATMVNDVFNNSVEKSYTTKKEEIEYIFEDFGSPCKCFEFKYKNINVKQNTWLIDDKFIMLFQKIRTKI